MGDVVNDTVSVVRSPKPMTKDEAIAYLNGLRTSAGPGVSGDIDTLISNNGTLTLFKIMFHEIHFLKIAMMQAQHAVNNIVEQVNIGFDQVHQIIAQDAGMEHEETNAEDVPGVTVTSES